ncbi:hypothetical protein DICPUDRAFT_155139 [Dictyostelium purpureum]|uniref:C2H2-type domain-containing protein n=1 Tax=Dictyostelium purpureum TaxID=5786 RepID=F0ZT62_DICPU|nr:uncharacterized protein DICPUDRAFT_155139 [Dictyostelium purpureum]EGC32860.1 hypothetical protein DICPUDRAFT_155139 [Dictyostelium purpureum]|eukprot:XP_003290612.1 hypothetical protein DICPUDRAFT_155139 [Dictyostelium purpureum]
MEDWSKWPSTQPLSSPLSFEFKKASNINNNYIQSDSEDYSTSESESISSTSTVKYHCLLCNHFEYESRTILEHLFNSHQFVIADVNQIANLSSYLEQWKKKMVGKPLTEFTTVIQTQTSKTEPVTNYFLLSDILPEDQDLRRKLQTERINYVLQEQHSERTNPNFICVCPMCPIVFKGERSNVTTHLYEQHNFNIGLSDNLINLKEFMEILKSKFDLMQCLYCDKIFKSTAVLKLHMKKKKHTRLNPTNTTYDRFYLLNYLEPGKNWEDLKKSTDNDDDDNNQISNNLDLLKQAQKENSGNHQVTHWDDWTEDSDLEPEECAVCLFCENQFDNSDLTFEHMENKHNFNFEKLRKSWNLDYYESMKLLNFIRRQTHQLVCCHCGETHQDKPSLYSHFETNKDHCSVVKENPVWRDAQYLFPTYENDSILRNFEGFDEDENQDYLQAEQEYQSHLFDEMIQNRDDILKKMQESNINF